jgi:hypothetical protein
MIYLRRSIRASNCIYGNDAWTGLFLFKATTHSLINKQTVIFADKDSVI